MKTLMSAPWYTYANTVKQMFARDKDITVSDLIKGDGSFDYVINIEVKNHKKAVALERVLCTGANFGNVKVGIIVYDTENNLSSGNAEIFNDIFDGNPIVQDIRVIKDQADTEHVYVRFKPEIIQFFNDDLSDYDGNWTGLAEDIARDIFKSYAHVNFCTAPIVESPEKGE